MTAARDVLTEMQGIAARFQVLYYNLFGWGERAFNWYEWRGVPVRKCPEDLWRYQDIIWRTKPDVIIETGVAHGGSALWFADVCQALGRGRVVACDVGLGGVAELVWQNPRIRLFEGDSSSPEVSGAIRATIEPGERVMVTLDSDHHAPHVLEELRLYSGLVTPGCYLVVEDTNLNGNPVQPNFGPGPLEAVNEFLAEHGAAWRRDRDIERSMLTFNPGGFLVRR